MKRGDFFVLTGGCIDVMRSMAEARHPGKPTDPRLGLIAESRKLGAADSISRPDAKKERTR